MARRHYHLPSLTSLNTFESCARQVSFKLASRELGVTLGAVSRQIKQLEGELGCGLFIRNQRGVTLTQEGMELQNSLSASFSNIANACRSIQLRGYQSNVTIAATTAFASLWLMPRLSEFWDTHKNIIINHAISDNANDVVYQQSDIRIRYGAGEWPGETSVILFKDVIYPVCGQDLLKGKKISDPIQLLQYPLLQLDGLDPQWSTWEEWMSQWGVDDCKTNFRRFTNYLIALQAAEKNQGVSLGWHSLVEPLIKDGKLMRIGKWEIPAPCAFYLTWDTQGELSQDAKLLQQWLLTTVSFF
ncbi:MAG: LysR family transcriptional regulator [Gammaproteobacteria bacterium]|nr:LysR family transcriptional regulator [Gammaproteobacteria bacterium]